MVCPFLGRVLATSVQEKDTFSLGVLATTVLAGVLAATVQEKDR